MSILLLDINLASFDCLIMSWRLIGQECYSVAMVARRQRRHNFCTTA